MGIIMKEVHPFAAIFPEMTGDEFAALVADIRANGLHEPIDLYEDKTLDGRNRDRACADLGIVPMYRNFTGSEAEARAYVISKNLHRRHLNESQRAYVAAQFAQLHRGRTSNRPMGTLAQSEAATLMNVGVRSVRRAAIVRDHGTPEEKAAVQQGEQSVRHLADKINERKKSEPSKDAPKPRGRRGRRRSSGKRPAPTSPLKSRHDSDLDFLEQVWVGACASARSEFMSRRGFQWTETAAAVSGKGG